MAWNTLGKAGALMRLLILALMLVGCGTPGHNSGWLPSAELEQRHTTYFSLLPTVRDASGFVDTDRCDSLLFSALTAVGAGDRIELEAAEVEPGKWLRRPVQYPECFSSGGSQSEISQDMLLGVLWYAWRTEDLGMLERLYAYGEQNNWVMGEGLVSRTVMRPPLRATLAQMIWRLGGQHRPIISSVGDPWITTGIDGYQAHLQVLHILLRQEAYGRLSLAARRALESHYGREPRNPLFAAAAATIGLIRPGDAERVLLQSPHHFPDRLATSSDRCEEWTTQRDYSGSYEPCPEQGRTHSPGDWLFAYRILRGLAL